MVFQFTVRDASSTCLSLRLHSSWVYHRVVTARRLTQTFLRTLLSTMVRRVVWLTRVAETKDQQK